MYHPAARVCMFRAASQLALDGNEQKVAVLVEACQISWRFFDQGRHSGRRLTDGLLLAGGHRLMSCSLELATLGPADEAERCERLTTVVI